MRRLSTEGIVELFAEYNFNLVRAYYGNQQFGGIKFLTGNDLRFILDVTDPQAALSLSSARSLRVLRYALVMIWLMRKPTVVVKNKLAQGLNSLRDYFLLTIALMAYPLSKFVDW